MSVNENSCEFVTYRATLETPAEYCEEPALPGEDYCEDHMPWDDEPPDEYWFEDDDLEPFE